MNTDKQCINNIIKAIEPFKEKFSDELSKNNTHPLDDDVLKILMLIHLENDSDIFEIYRYQEQVIHLWKLLIKKSIICLRYFDNREPFQTEGNKTPHAYGVNELSDYFKKYTDFEEVLYGGAKYYRDHVMHVFRVWLLGIRILLDNNFSYLESIEVEKGYGANALEKLSMWTIIALTHDLGYPLEKALQIFERTKGMMKFFVSNPNANLDISFSGVQNSMNDFVLRFISSKMWEIDPQTRKTLEEIPREVIEDNSDRRFVARLQPKYYFKFQKSLEHNQHGIISALIIYKLLLYFLESDYSINEDYMFDIEDTRQFYIRREILRAIASHTCHDVYQMNLLKFSFLLIICDDAQEWGRKSISELYYNKQNKYSYEGIEFSNKEGDTFVCKFKDKQEVNDEKNLELLLQSYYRQSKTYRNVFRDGQDTVKRNFEFIRQLTIEWKSDKNVTYLLTLNVLKDEQTKIEIKISGEEKFGNKDLIISNFNKLLQKANNGVDSVFEFNDTNTKATYYLR